MYTVCIHSIFRPKAPKHLAGGKTDETTAQNAIALLPSVTGKKAVEEKNDAVLKDMKKQLTGLTDKGLKQLVASAEKEIQKRKKAKKTEPIDVKEITKTEKAS